MAISDLNQNGSATEIRAKRDQTKDLYFQEAEPPGKIKKHGARVAVLKE